MQRRETEGRRQGAERDATQPIAGQPRTDDEEEHLEEPERVPSLLTARELEARKPRKEGLPTGETDASASFDGEPDEPPITDDKPAKRKR
jgi:hypothetical protein